MSTKERLHVLKLFQFKLGKKSNNDKYYHITNMIRNKHMTISEIALLKITPKNN